MSFIYSLIANEKKVVLAEYSEYSGNFSQIVRSILTKIVKGEKFNSFLILSERYVAIHTWHNLLIFRIPTEGKEENKEIIEKDYSNLEIDTYAGLIFKNIEENDVYFYSVLSGQNMINLWKLI